MDYTHTRGRITVANVTKDEIFILSELGLVFTFARDVQTNRFYITFDSMEFFRAFEAHVFMNLKSYLDVQTQPTPEIKK